MVRAGARAHAVGVLFILIVACEVGFWLLLLGGLLARYRLRMPRLGAALLVLTPLVDVVLLVATTIDLHNGAEAGPVHALAAIYVGVSVAYGPAMVRWADVRMAHRLGEGPAPTPAPKQGPEHARHERRQWFRHLLAWAVGCSLLLLAWLLVGDADRGEQLLQTAELWCLVLVIDGIISWSYTFSPRRAS
jgi:hypothetical protein